MFRRMRCLVGLDPKSAPSRRILSSKSAPSSQRRAVVFKPPDMLETLHEIAIYIHRFHNLDLFQQGWYQIKVSVRWEDSSRESCGTPARVVQYEAPDVGSDDVLGIWKIDDADHSFYTQPFRIKYARQDVYLCVMVSFNLLIGQDEGPSTSAVILKFELMYAPLLENGYETQTSFDVPAAVHEFRVPYKALLGLHSYCPVHFDVFHSVLVDLTIHIAFLKSGTATSSLKILNQGLGSKAIEIINSLLASRGILLAELQKISEAIGQTIDDLQDADLNLGRFELINSSLKPRLPGSSAGSSNKKMGVGQLAGILQNILEKSDGMVDFGNDVMLYTLSKEELLDLFLTVGNQLSFIWNAFLNFHRINRIKIIEHLYDVWAADRKAEWSIWTVHSKIDMPTHYLRSGADDSSHRNSLGKVVVSRKFSDDPAQSAISRAELHRKSIAQMKINTRSIQDMHIFGDPSRVPVVLIEQHVMNVPQHGSSKNLSLNLMDQNDTAALPRRPVEHGMPKVNSGKRSGRVLKGHHLDLRLVRNQWLLLDPGAECLMSEANEDKTSGDFREMGRRLAEEVITFLKKKMDKLARYGGCKDIKLSFVGHSIGNIIIRSALSESAMGPFLKHLYTYVSLSGPHLGYWYSSNSLFNSGLWLLKKLKGAQCIHQLTFTDDQDLPNTFFYKLCKQKTLENFKNIILLSSPQDGYVPYHSARIELCPASSWDNSKKAQIFMEMLNNCLDQIRAPTSERRVFMRCDVNFDTSLQGRNLNTIIGRAAHIEFLETDTFAKFIMWSFPELFL
ncbi:Protein FAM135B [Ananas comosus]|uniref:Protein FAM135B n=1 Tax=Ananas comosus TaxID=4615 RepID=A0A199VA87_ANACO|nr:Protein FAM135B [Ananas comosus]